ncbi:hemagglutination protein, partial [bacterium]|nr:hemagglutination protein [bacterium]
MKRVIKTYSAKTIRVTVAAAMLASASPFGAMANPVGGVVSGGSATIGSNGNVLTVNQSTNRAVIDWRGFDIAPH